MKAKSQSTESLTETTAPSDGGSGSQTHLRGLDVLEAVASGVTALSDIADAVDLSRSTTHRLAQTLVKRPYLVFTPFDGYALGSKSLELGHQARMQLDIPRVARRYLENLAANTGDTVHLGVLDGSGALYLDKIPGGRRVDVASRVGELQPLRSTGLGKALILDKNEMQLRDFYRSENGKGPYSVPENVWIQRMIEYANLGYAFDLEENEDCIRCVAAPVRDLSGKIVAAISVSSAAQYMNDKRMQDLAEQVRSTAVEISCELGWGAQ